MLSSKRIKDIKINSLYTNLAVAIVISVLVASFFVFWHPAPKDDLSRYFAWLDNLRTFDGEVLLRYILSRGEVITMGYAYLIAKTGAYGLFQFLPTFLSLFIVQYMAIDFSKRRNYSMKYAWAAILIFLSLHEIVEMVSSVRSPLAFSIVGLAFYLEFVVKKKHVWWMYIVAFFVHFGSIIPVAIRLVLLFKTKKSRSIAFAVMCLLSVVPVGNAILFFTGSDMLNANLIQINIYKLGSYLSYYAPLSNPYVYKISKVMLLTVFAYIAHKYNPKDRYVTLYLLTSIFTLFSFGHYLLWYRFLDYLLISSPVVMISALSGLRNNRKYFSAAVFILIAFMVVGLYVQSSYFSSDFTVRMPAPGPFEGWAL